LVGRTGRALKPNLAKDIAVEQLKEREKVKAYFDEL